MLASSTVTFCGEVDGFMFFQGVQLLKCYKQNRHSISAMNQKIVVIKLK